ncbi:MAG: catechol 2,3-dioxygenase-like lactoylglutathione lyase family enzyme [Acidimicrobiales bacterium]|jgi:catechol 2,3-dioxygenase-like lactoylglutathione lyase family enzyme
MGHNQSAKNSEFTFGGINHIALVCSDMERTVDFYTNVLGMPLFKTLEIPGGGQHFFFDCGNGDSVAFFWFPGAPAHAPGIAAAGEMPGGGNIVSAHGSMNHLAFDVPEDKFDEYVQKLKNKGVETSPVLNHDDSESTVARELHEGVYVRSVYFRDPDGVLLEFATWTRDFGADDVLHPPVNAEGERAESITG